MVRSRVIWILLMLASLAPSPAVSAAEFKCDWLPAGDGARTAGEIDTLLPSGDVLDHPEQLDAAIDALRRQGMTKSLIIDNLIGTYCPVVAADSSLTDAQKTGRIRQFAARIAGIVYSVESADEIIFDVPFPPDVADTINARASAAKLTPEGWIAELVGEALKAD